MRQALLKSILTTAAAMYFMIVAGFFDVQTSLIYFVVFTLIDPRGYWWSHIPSALRRRK